MDNIDNMDKIRVLRMMHRDLKVIAPDIVEYTDDENRIVMDLNGEVLDKFDINTTYLAGSFVVVDADELVLYNYIDGRKSKKVDTPRSRITRSMQNITALGDKFISFRSWDENTIIFNSDLEELVTYKDCPYINPFKDTEVGVWYSFRSGFNMPVNYGYANKISKKIEIFGSFELDNGYSLISTEVEKNKGLSINSNNLENLKYRLAKNGNIIGEKSHSDIVKLLGDNNYYLSYDTSNDGKRLLGIIDNHGKEILDALYDDIICVGSGLFILESNGYKTIYDVKGMRLLFNYGDIKNLYQHQTLPITIVQLINNSFVCVGTNGDVYYTTELARHLDCCYSLEHNNILKINIGNGIIKYVTNRLVPITNISEIAKLQADTWIKM